MTIEFYEGQDANWLRRAATCLDGLHGDCSATFSIGAVSPEARAGPSRHRAEIASGHRPAARPGGRAFTIEPMVNPCGADVDVLAAF